MSRRKQHKTDDALAAVNLAIAKARLAKLAGELPTAKTPEYTRLEDLQPLCPEDEKQLKQKFINLLDWSDLAEQEERETYEWYISMAHLAP